MRPPERHDRVRSKLAAAAPRNRRGAREAVITIPGGHCVSPSAKPRNQTAKRFSRRKLNLEDYRALGAYRHALRRFLAYSEAGARRQGLTPQQHQALLAIRAHIGPEPMSVGELAECLLIKNHSAVGLVARLEDRGLVLRAASEVDRRRVVLTLTAEAEAKLEIISRDNLGELKSSAFEIADLLETIARLEQRGVWSPRSGKGS